MKASDDDALASAWATATNGFVIDTELPVSKIQYPQNGGNLKNVNQIIGHSTDTTGVDFTRISIYNASTGYYYGGTTFSEATETWLMTTATNDNATSTKWTYAIDQSKWDSGSSYTIRSRATDLAGNEEHTDAITFTYDTVNGVEGSIYASNPAVMNNSDYKIYYPNFSAVPLNGSIEIDFDDSFKFSPWLEDADVSFTDDGGNITSSSDTFDRVNKKITSTITAGNVNANDLIELSIENLRIHNPSASGSYALPIKLYNNIGGLIEFGTGEIIVTENYQQVEINVDIEQSLQVSVDSGSVALSVDPDVQLGQNWDGTGGVVTEKTAVEVKTNAIGGYDLLISLAGNTATGSAVLDGTTNTGNQITSSSGDRVATENNFSFATNSGSLVNGTAFTNSATTITGAGTSAPTNTKIDDIFYYLNVDYETPADVYRGTITYTAVGQF